MPRDEAYQQREVQVVQHRKARVPPNEISVQLRACPTAAQCVSQDDDASTCLLNPTTPVCCNRSVRRTTSNPDATFLLFLCESVSKRLSLRGSSRTPPPRSFRCT